MLVMWSMMVIPQNVSPEKEREGEEERGGGREREREREYISGRRTSFF